MDATLTKDGFSLDRVKAYTAESTERWSRLCQDFFDAEREHMLKKEPTPEDLAAHRTTCKWLIRFTHIMLAVADTEPIDHKLIAELEGRLIQLKLSWRQFQEAISEEEADKILRQVFGDDYDK